MFADINLDIFLDILFLSILHPSFALLLWVFMYAQGYELSGPVMFWTNTYTFTVCFFWSLGFLTKKFNNGWNNKPLSWDDEVVVITGGSRGMGGLLAETLAINATVVVLDIRPPEMEHGNIIYYECDVSNFSNVQKVAEKIVNDVGHPTILINNAGIVRGKTILDASEQEVTSTIETNLLASFWTTKVFLPEMVKNNHGHIVNVASAVGYYGFVQLSDYCASKAAMISFHESLRLELDYRYNAKKVRTTLVCPGHMHTGMFNGVRSKVDLLSPSLEPLKVVKKIIIALDKNESTHIMTPHFIYTMPILRLLPAFLIGYLSQIMGVNAAMKTWKDTRDEKKNI